MISVLTKTLLNDADTNVYTWNCYNTWSRRAVYTARDCDIVNCGSQVGESIVLEVLDEDQACMRKTR